MAAPAIDPDAIELIHPDFYVAHGYPHEAWRTLRAHEPVYWFEKRDGTPFWAITKHADIVRIGKDPKRFLNGPRLVVDFEERKQPPAEVFPPTLIQLDPPKHNKYRQLVSKRFTPRELKKIHGDIENIAFEIVDSLFQEGEEGECDFVEKISAPLPIAVIAWLLGVPKEDWDLLFRWTNEIIGAGDPEYQREDSSDNTARGAMVELFQYFAKLMEEKKKHPTDDLTSLIAHAKIDGEPLPVMDVLAYYLIIVIAGNETTRNATSGGMLALIEHQDELRKLQAKPELLKSAIEEILRWTSPIIHFARTATEDVQIRDKRIKAGDVLALFYPSANRDEEIFDDPYSFRIDRSPNRHLAFGIGEHFCAGAHVARLELEMAYKYLLPRIQEIELAGPVQRLRSQLVGGVKHLPVRYKLSPAK